MPVPDEIKTLLADFGTPAGAIALALVLVRGARALEDEASEPALKYISSLLVNGGVGTLGKLGATLIPAIFHRVFGSRPLGFKFLSRSVFASSLFWLILLVIKHPYWEHIWQDFTQNIFTYYFIIPMMYFTDWISLLKARVIIKIMTRKFAIISTAAFSCLDITISFMLPGVSAHYWGYGHHFSEANSPTPANPHPVHPKEVVGVAQSEAGNPT